MGFIEYGNKLHKTDSRRSENVIMHIAAWDSLPPAQNSVSKAKPIMLALSRLRECHKAVEAAIQEAKQSKNLIVVYVIDVNVAKHLIYLDVGLHPKLKAKCEKELLEEYRAKAKERIKAIVEKVEGHGIRVTTRICIGKFALECLRGIREEMPELVITARSKRPMWVKKLLGSPVDHLAANAACPVIEV